MSEFYNPNLQGHKAGDTDIALPSPTLGMLIRGSDLTTHMHRRVCLLGNIVDLQGPILIIKTTDGIDIRCEYDSSPILKESGYVLVSGTVADTTRLRQCQKCIYLGEQELDTKQATQVINNMQHPALTGIYSGPLN